MGCDIIIPVWNQFAFTKDCVESVFKNTSADYRLIIIDNASDDETRRYLESLASNPAVTVIRNERNEGFVRGANQGLSFSKAPYACLLNNDTIVTEGWLKTMVDIAESRKDIGIVNPSSNNLGQRPGPNEPIDLYAARLARTCAKDFVELGSAVGFCMLIKRAVIERIGLFDEVYGMGNFEDTDYSRRAVKEGFLCVRACGAYVFHRERTSFSRLKNYEDDFKRNKEIYEFRWGHPKRVAYILDSYDDNILKRIQMESLRLARNGNWVWYFTREHVDVPRHSNIIYKETRQDKFYLKTIFAILKKKKRFDEILAGGRNLQRVLERLSFIHRAKVGSY